MKAFFQSVFRIVLAVSLIILLIQAFSWFSSTQRSLPRAAQDIKDEYMPGGISDGSYYLTARVSSEGFDAFVVREKLIQGFNGKFPSGVWSWSSNGPDWWHPPLNPAAGRYLSKPGESRVAVYSNGWLYYQRSNW